jgi:hypothetical protein
MMQPPTVPQTVGKEGKAVAVVRMAQHGFKLLYSAPVDTTYLPAGSCCSSDCQQVPAVTPVALPCCSQRQCITDDGSPGHHIPSLG